MCFAFPLITPCLALKNTIGDYVLKNLKKIWYLSFCALFVTTVFVSAASAQNRPRVTKSISSQPINQPPAIPADKTKPLASSRPVLTNQPVVVAPPIQPLVKKTGMSSLMSSASGALAAGRLAYNPSVSAEIIRGIETKLGIPYRYGSTGPYRYDCSGFVWSVFNGGRNQLYAVECPKPVGHVRTRDRRRTVQVWHACLLKPSRSYRDRRRRERLLSRLLE